MNSSIKQRGIFFVLVGPGGAGKDTIMNNVYDLTAHNTDYRLNRLVTATTRSMREKEQDGVDYHFKTKDAFQRMIENDELIEHQQVTSGNYYGIPRASVEPFLIRNEHVLGDVDVLGAKRVIEAYHDDAVVIFVTVGSEDTPQEERLNILRQRMEHRKDKPEAIAERLERARTLEFPFQVHCQATIYNDDIDQATQALMKIIEDKIAHRHAQVV